MNLWNFQSDEKIKVFSYVNEGLLDHTQGWHLRMRSSCQETQPRDERKELPVPPSSLPPSREGRGTRGWIETKQTYKEAIPVTRLPSVSSAYWWWEKTAELYQGHLDPSWGGREREKQAAAVDAKSQRTQKKKKVGQSGREKKHNLNKSAARAPSSISKVKINSNTHSSVVVQKPWPQLDGEGWPWACSPQAGWSLRTDNVHPCGLTWVTSPPIKQKNVHKLIMFPMTWCLTLPLQSLPPSHQGIQVFWTFAIHIPCWVPCHKCFTFSFTTTQC